MSEPVARMVVRGKVIEDDLIRFGGRGGDLEFLAPDPARHGSLLPLTDPGRMADLHRLSFEEILDYLEELGARLDVGHNVLMQEARELSYLTAPTTPPIMDTFYANIPAMFRREVIREWVDKSVGIRYLEDWVDQPILGATLSIRAYGSRAVHVIAGNGPVLGALTLIRGAVTRSDTIVKLPSNDPFTTVAIARTMADFAPDHPITRHFSVAYWRGGDEAFEKQLYQPHNVEKIIAWGGFASVKHVTRYIQPGLELISLDPKTSASVVGAEAFASEESLQQAAVRIAADFGSLNQVTCSSARLVYAMSGTDEAGLAKLKRLGELAYQALLELPPWISTTPKAYDPQLRAHVDAARLNDDWYHVVGGRQGEGAVIISLLPEAVSFAHLLGDRTVNLIPADTIDDVLAVVDASTQTVGIYPDSLIPELRHRMALHGAQRFTRLGFGSNGPGLVGPQDGIEPLRRMCKWIFTESPSADSRPLWEHRAQALTPAL